MPVHTGSRVKEHAGWSRTEGTPQALGRLPFIQRGCADKISNLKKSGKVRQFGCIGANGAETRRRADGQTEVRVPRQRGAGLASSREQDAHSAVDYSSKAEAKENVERRKEVRMAGAWSDWSEAHQSAARWYQYIQGCLEDADIWLAWGPSARENSTNPEPVRGESGKTLHGLLPRRRMKGGGGDHAAFVGRSSYVVCERARRVLVLSAQCSVPSAQDSFSIQQAHTRTRTLQAEPAAAAAAGQPRNAVGFASSQLVAPPGNQIIEQIKKS
jgi:hypothetical protein